MDFLAFQRTIETEQNKKWTPRQKRLDALKRALYGDLYAHIAFAFYDERGSGGVGRRLSLSERRAAIEWNLPWILAREVTGNVWGEDHRPNLIVRDDDYSSAWAMSFVQDASIWLTMIQASMIGAIGSACIVLRILAEGAEPGQFFAEVWEPHECSPVFKRARPGDLRAVTRTYEISVDALRADGYDVDALIELWERKRYGASRSGDRKAAKAAGDSVWVMRCTLDEQSETWYSPVPRWLYQREDFKDSDFVEDPERSTQHQLGECPAIWVVPVPLKSELFPDGLGYIEPAIDFQLRIDRTMSQVGRAFDYAGDPQLAQTRSQSGNGTFGDDDEFTSESGATASDIITTDEKGGAYFVEIEGDGLKTAIDVYVKTLRQLAREVVGASRIDDESKPGQKMSGAAMKMLNAALFTLVGILRITTGEQGLIKLVRLAMRMSLKVDVELPSLAARLAESDVDEGLPDPKAMIETQWPNNIQPDGQDKLFEVQAIKAAASTEGGPPLMTVKTAVGNAAPLFDVVDAGKEYDAMLSEQSDREKLTPVDPTLDPDRDDPKDKNNS